MKSSEDKIIESFENYLRTKFLNFENNSQIDKKLKSYKKDLNEIIAIQSPIYKHIDRDLATKLATKFLETSKEHTAPYVMDNFHELVNQVFNENFTNYNGTRYQKKETYEHTENTYTPKPRN